MGTSLQDVFAMQLCRLRAADPSVVAISINHSNYTNECIKQYKRVGVTILSEDTEPGIIGGFGYSSGRDTDKFDGLDYIITNGLPFPETGMRLFFG